MHFLHVILTETSKDLCKCKYAGHRTTSRRASAESLRCVTGCLTVITDMHLLQSGSLDYTSPEIGGFPRQSEKCVTEASYLPTLVSLWPTPILAVDVFVMVIVVAYVGRAQQRCSPDRLYPSPLLVCLRRARLCPNVFALSHIKVYTLKNTNQVFIHIEISKKRQCSR